MGDFECCCLESIWYTIFDDQWPIAMTQLPLACMCEAYVCGVCVFNGCLAKCQNCLRGFTCTTPRWCTDTCRTCLSSINTGSYTYQSTMLLSKLLLALCQHCNVPASLETATMPYECVPSQIYSIHTTLLYVAGMKQ